MQPHYDTEVPQVLFAASQAVVDEMCRQLQEVFCSYAVPAPVLTSYRRWADERYFGYAYHPWARGADDRIVIAQLARPFADIALYTCGEAFSDQQGWVNAALRTADIVLTQHFGLPPRVPNEG